jgi:hypothetical protein
MYLKYRRKRIVINVLKIDKRTVINLFKNIEKRGL